MYKKSVQSNVCPILFAAISNKIRRLIFLASYQTLCSKFISLLRVDVDSLLIRFVIKKEAEDELKNIFKSIGYTSFKIELDNILHYISFKKRSYALFSPKTSIWKCPGLQMSFSNRRCLDIKKLITDNFLKVRKTHLLTLL